ncbi:hypothetical protein Y032_0014g2466 [Ancylostoma ceylanicum]|uniref:Secreted protein n=1 Tax=Ancylostoma ceylanicum TaxID=53326 RepID=A0A016V9L6_9BILA|nr:hypothetical protein Y032_0014g2466 [Ancylostoma ceylanicum]
MSLRRAVMTILRCTALSCGMAGYHFGTSRRCGTQPKWENPPQFMPALVLPPWGVGRSLQQCNAGPTRDEVRASPLPHPVPKIK